MLHYALGSAAEEHALITGISMGRDDNQVGFQFSSSCTNLFVSYAGARLECQDIAVRPVFQDKRLQAFNETPVPCCLWHHGKRQQCRRWLPREVCDMQKMHIRPELAGNRQRIRDGL